MRDAATSQKGHSLLVVQATFVCHSHDAVTAEQTPCAPSDLITEASFDD